MSIGDRINSMLGKSFKTSKFKMLAKLTIVRIAILKKNHMSRCSQAMSDVVSLLKFGQQQDALLRVQHLIKEQHVLEMFHMIESYCNLLKDQIKLIKKSRDCPEELKEAIHTLIYAASRCGGEFHELQEMRAGFTKWFGKEFADDAVELGKSSQVNMTILPMISTRQPSLETRTAVLRQIAFQNGIALHLEEKVETKEQPETDKDLPDSSGEVTDEDDIIEAMKDGKEYQDAAAAAQDAYESAAYAAVAARAAVQLSRSETQQLEDNKT